MSEESLARSKRREQEAALQRDFEACRCTILTELHGGKWRIHGFGPKLKDGKPDLVAIAVEFDKLEDMLIALPGVAAGFYNVVEPHNQTSLIPGLKRAATDVARLGGAFYRQSK